MKPLRAIAVKTSLLVFLVTGFLLMSNSMSVHAQTARSDGLPPSSVTICTSTPVWNGWIIAGEAYDLNCGVGTFPYVNEYTIVPYYNVSLGGTLTACIGDIPAGWTQIAEEKTGKCLLDPSITSGPDSMVIQRTSIGTPLINPSGVVNGTDYSPNDIYPGTTVSIFGLNFNAPDLVIVTQGSNQWAIAAGSSYWFDGNPLWAQINATLPTAMTSGLANVYVQNAEGLRSSPETITIR